MIFQSTIAKNAGQCSKGLQVSDATKETQYCSLSCTTSCIAFERRQNELRPSVHLKPGPAVKQRRVADHDRGTAAVQPLQAAQLR
jgi:hypothetical protein